MAGGITSGISEMGSLLIATKGCLAIINYRAYCFFRLAGIGSKVELWGCSKICLSSSRRARLRNYRHFSLLVKVRHLCPGF